MSAERRVRIDPVYIMYYIDSLRNIEEYNNARNGSAYFTDRIRFTRRIQLAGEVLEKILQTNHRTNVFHSRFDTNVTSSDHADENIHC